MAAITCMAAHAEEFENNGVTIITDNFKVEDAKKPTDQSILVVKSDNEIGSLGDKSVVVGEKDPQHLAYVKTADDHNYIITNKLLVQCNNDVYCIPSGLDAEQLSRNIYEVTVQSYEQWEALKEELTDAYGVRSVSSSYEHGIEPSLK